MIQIINIQHIGKNILNSLKTQKDSYRMLHNAMKNITVLKNPSIRSVLYRQIYFTGIEALNKIVLLGTLIGIIIITQVKNIVGSNAVLTGKILVWTMLREVGPLFAAIIIIARSCTAIAAELGSMKVNREMDSLRVMGINPFFYLIIPRIAGITIAVFILTFYFQVSAIIGGLVLSSLLVDIPFFQHVASIFSVLSFFEIGISFLKSAIFGLVISTVSCYHGFGVQASITEIPQATIKAVMQSLFIVFIFNGIITLISFL